MIIIVYWIKGNKIYDDYLKITLRRKWNLNLRKIRKFNGKCWLNKIID